MIRNSIKILYEDDDVVAVDKPAGLVVHSDGRTKEKTLTDWVVKKYPEAKFVGEEMTLQDGTIIARPGIVHRLDRETSGVIVIAKNQAAFLFLKEQFQERETKKVYHAFVWGPVAEERGMIDRPIARSKADFRLWTALRGKKGEEREAVTVYKTLLRSKDFSFLEVLPKTGRTHQIRVHLKAVGHPVIGDVLYAPKRGFALGFERLALHASSLTFTTLSGAEITARAPFPEDFVEAQKLLEKDAVK